MLYRTICAVIVLCILPAITHATVLINEIAWMGTPTSANDEWIELYNTGSFDVSLDGWTLSDAVSLSIPLMGTLAAGSYAVLERTDDDTVPGTAFLIYTGSLANTGRTLTLFRDDATPEDQVVGGDNWANVGGDNTTKNTAQRTNAGWITNTATPGEANEVVSTEGSGTANTSSESANTQSNTTGGSSGGSHGVSNKIFTTKSKIVNIHEEPVLGLTMKAPETVYVNQDVLFEVSPKGIGKTLMDSLSYTWNFGDTYTGSKKKVVHRFEYPGEYVVIVDAEYAKNKASTRQEVVVLPVSFSLERLASGDVLLHNNAKYEVDIGGFTLIGKTSLTFPTHTVIKQNATLIISKKRIDTTSPLTLRDAQKSIIVSEMVSKQLQETRPRAVSNISDVSKIPARKQSAEVAQKAILATTTESKAISGDVSNVIQIGNMNATSGAEGGILTRFFRKLTNFFN